ncbi:uncharacterized protein LTR77_003175 [Saxophila tyrrhenica]|uniref:Uncharacterized protein n=1 Tax=Saxophila tyrrhenica TaxID=1690608 RepID=A0AAV9PIE8_9PEZI|nr:hypothetical protein LTR77_003175 [Saxophila tyrrhenica]
MELLALLSLTFLPLALARGPYCGRGLNPDVAHYQAAIKKLNSGSDYPTGTEFDADDCRIRVDVNSPISAPLTTGSTMIDVANSMLSQCNGIGWGFNDPNGGFNTNISVVQCTECMYGKCGVCSAPETRKPRKRRDAAAPMAESIASSQLGMERKDQLFGQTTHSLERRGVSCESAPGLDWTYCCPSIAAPDSDDCEDLANSLRGRTLELPFTGASGDCEVAIESYRPDNSVSGDTIADRMIADVQGCDSGGIVGTIHDYSVGIAQPGAYDVLFGQLCGDFGSGVSACAIGDSP